MSKNYILSSEEMGTIIKMAGEAGAASYRRERAKADRMPGRHEITRDRLRSYRRVKLAVQDAEPLPVEIRDVYQKALGDLMDVRELEAGKAVRIIRADAELWQKNAHDIAALERAVSLYGKECEKSGREEAKRRFKVLWLMHMDPEEMTVEEVAEKVGANKRTVYRDLDAAYAAVSDYYLGMG